MGFSMVDHRSPILWCKNGPKNPSIERWDFIWDVPTSDQRSPRDWRCWSACWSPRHAIEAKATHRCFKGEIRTNGRSVEMAISTTFKWYFNSKNFGSWLFSQVTYFCSVQNTQLFLGILVWRFYNVSRYMHRVFNPPERLNPKEHSCDF